MKKIILAAVIVVFAAACNPRQFYLNLANPNADPISGLTLGPLQSAKIIGENAAEIYEGGAIAARLDAGGLTQLGAEFNLTLLRGEGAKIYIRNAADGYQRRKSIVFDYSTEGSIVYEGDKPIAEADSVKARLNEEARVKIENYGKIVKITVDCDTVFYGKTEIPATEYLIIESLKKSRLRATAIKFYDLRNEP